MSPLRSKATAHRKYGKIARRISTPISSTPPAPGPTRRLASSSSDEEDDEESDRKTKEAVAAVLMRKEKGKGRPITNSTLSTRTVTRSVVTGSGMNEDASSIARDRRVGGGDVGKGHEERVESTLDAKLGGVGGKVKAMQGRRTERTISGSPSVSPTKNQGRSSFLDHLAAPSASASTPASTSVPVPRKRSPSPLPIDITAEESPPRRKRRVIPKAIDTINPNIFASSHLPVASTSTLPPQPPVRRVSSKPVVVALLPERPRSPAKDLSSLFSRYQDQTVESQEEGQSQRSGGLVATLGMRSPESQLESPKRPSLNRSSSAPDIGTPPPPPSSLRRSAKPNSPSSRPLGPANSLPSLLNASPTNRSREPSPTKPFQPRTIHRIGTGLGVERSRTYGNGAIRSFKKDDEEERLFGPTSVASVSDSGNKTPSSLLGSLGTTASARVVLPRRPAERETYSALRRRWGAESDDETDESKLSPAEASELKSFTQLRARGENTRFIDEFNYLVEGLGKGMAIGVRRASAIEVLRKITDVEFVRRLKSSGFVERVYLEFRKAEAGDGDRILDPCLALLIAILARDQRIAAPLLRVSPAVDPSVLVADDEMFDEPVCEVLLMLSGMMNRSWASETIGRGSGKGLSKIEIRTLVSIREMIDKSELIADTSLPINLRSLCLIAISIISSFTPTALFRPQSLLCSSGTLVHVINALVLDVSPLDARITRFENGLDLIPSDGSISFTLIDTSLRILEVCHAADPSAALILLHHLPTLVASFVFLMRTCHVLLRDSSTTSQECRKGAMECLTTTLRMLFELTTTDPTWSIEIVRIQGALELLVAVIVEARLRSRDTPVVAVHKADAMDERPDEEGEEEEQKKGKFGLLCLALGVLTNLVETVETTRDIVRESRMSSTCEGSRSCARGCQCSDRTSVIDRLAELYLDPLDDSDDALETTFVNGYFGIVLGLIMIDTPANQVLVRAALGDESEAMTKLLEIMEEFAGIHETAVIVVAPIIDAEGEGKEVATEGGKSELAEKVRRMLRMLKTAAA